MSPSPSSCSNSVLNFKYVRVFYIHRTYGSFHWNESANFGKKISKTSTTLIQFLILIFVHENNVGKVHSYKTINSVGNVDVSIFFFFDKIIYWLQIKSKLYRNFCSTFIFSEFCVVERNFHQTFIFFFVFLIFNNFCIAFSIIGGQIPLWIPCTRNTTLLSGYVTLEYLQSSFLYYFLASLLL